ncbi:MAG: site-2 protease family protein [Gemmatimonadota bacterium]|nr:site-2 protease family protein [Gemmatimonadota bacterium]
MPDPASAAAFYVVFLFSTVLHEAAHAWAALLGGDRTAYHGGQVSLDPRPHIKREPFGMVVLPLISVVLSGWPFGFASAPYDPRWAMRFPKRAALMALAGPAANLAMVLLAALALRLGFMTGVFEAPESIRFAHVARATGGGLWAAVAFVLGVFFSLNLVLFALNIIPLPPLDGSAAVPLLLSDRATEKYQQFLWNQPGLAWIGILIAWQVFDQIFNPLFLLVVNLLYPGVRYG